MDSKDPDSTTPQDRTDPNAPVELTLPSGKKVLIRSHRTLLGADGAFALNAQTGTGNGGPEIRTALIARMTTELEPGTAGTPALDGTIEAVHAQRIDDYRRLFAARPITEAYLLVLGASVIPDIDTWEDEAGPTKATPGSPSASGAESPS